MRLLLALLSMFILAASAGAQTYTINTAAGNGTRGYSGDGGPATSAALNQPDGVAVDSSGNLYIADTNNSRIRKVTPGGTISTVAGTGTSGYSGDGGPATSAKLNSPYGVAVDSSGNLYIADEGNNRIRKVAPGGTISTVAGTGTSGYSGDGGPATSAMLYMPYGVAVDAAGNLYIVDTNNKRIRGVAPGGTIWTVAGNGHSTYSGDGGPAISASLFNPTGAAVAAAGRIYVADSQNDRIRILTPASAPSCTYSVRASPLGVLASGGDVGLNINTDPGCPWFLSGLPDWLTISGDAAGAGSAWTTLVVAASTVGSRVASVSIGGVWVPIRQMDLSACGGSKSCVIQVLPHLAFGNEWTTGLFAMNSATEAKQFSVAFYGDDGSSVALPFGGGLGI